MQKRWASHYFTLPLSWVRVMMSVITELWFMSWRICIAARERSHTHKLQGLQIFIKGQVTNIEKCCGDFAEQDNMLGWDCHGKCHCGNKNWNEFEGWGGLDWSVEMKRPFQVRSTLQPQQGQGADDWGRLKDRTSDGEIIRDSGRNVNARLTRWVVTRLQWEHFYIVEQMSVLKNIRINQEDIC